MRKEVLAEAVSRWLRDPAVHEAIHRRLGREVLRSHRGVLLSMTPDQQRAIAQMDPGPAASVGRIPERWK